MEQISSTPETQPDSSYDHSLKHGTSLNQQLDEQKRFEMTQNQPMSSPAQTKPEGADSKPASEPNIFAEYNIQSLDD